MISSAVLCIGDLSVLKIFNLRGYFFQFLFGAVLHILPSNAILHGYFQVLSPVATELMNKNQQKQQEAALHRRNKREKDKEEERQKAEHRKKMAEERAKREEEEFNRNKDAIFAEEEKRQREAREEHAQQVKQEEKKLEMMQQTPENVEDIIKDELEDAKKVTVQRIYFSEMCVKSCLLF